MTSEPAYPVPLEPEDALGPEELARLEAFTLESLEAPDTDDILRMARARAVREHELQLSDARRRLEAASKERARLEGAGALDEILAPIRPAPRPAPRVDLPNPGIPRYRSPEPRPVRREDVLGVAVLAEVHGAYSAKIRKDGIVELHYGRPGSDADRVVYYPDAHTATRAARSRIVRKLASSTEPPLPSQARPRDGGRPILARTAFPVLTWVLRLFLVALTVLGFVGYFAGPEYVLRAVEETGYAIGILVGILFG